MPASVPALLPSPHAAQRQLSHWLTHAALPLWARHGVDLERGGFFEKLGFDLQALHEPRRARVVARQMYVFATAERRGWLAGADALVEHGLAFLLNRLRQGDGTFAAAVEPDGRVVRPEFDLYEHAFVLFALASAYRGRPDRSALAAEARALLGRMVAQWKHPLAGFEEASPRRLPLLSNPHMHLMEAALEWEAVAAPADRPPWAALADEIAQLCLGRFIDAGSGALCEHFDADWGFAADRVVEPGHQFEWAWLLMRWGQARQGRQAPQAFHAARRLLHIGEVHGVDAQRGVAINSLDARLEPRDTLAKLWPQTERLKAWCLAAQLMPDLADQARTGMVNAAAGIAAFFAASPQGLWHEQMRPDGSFVAEPCRASSLYHVVCAIDAFASAPD